MVGCENIERRYPTIVQMQNRIIFGWFLTKTSNVDSGYNAMVVDSCEILPDGNSDERDQSSQMHSSCQSTVDISTI